MDDNRLMRVPPGRLACGIVLAMVVGGLLPLIITLEAMLLFPVFMVGGILLVYLYCYAGPVPAGLYILSQLVSCAYLGGATITLAAVVTNILPGMVTIRGIQLKQPFFAQLKRSIAMYVGGLLLAIVYAYAVYGGGMITRFMNLLRAQYDHMPDDYFAPFIDMYNNAMAGVSTMTIEVFRGQLNGMLDLMQQAYAASLAGMLMAGAMLSGVLSTLWGNWKMASRGFATSQSFVGMSYWFLPSRVTSACLFMLAAGWLISRGSYASGHTVYSTIGIIVGAVFAVQAAAAIDRRLMRGTMRTSARRSVITVVMALALFLPTLQTAVIMIGALSALFGSHGSIRLWLNNRQFHDNNGQ